MAGPGGNSYINPLYAQGYTIRGGPGSLYVGGYELPWYGGSAGKGGQNGNGQNGRIVIKY